MNNRRNFLRTSAFGVCGTSLFSFQNILLANAANHVFLVKQPEESETFFVRENTPITFHISKPIDNIASVSLLTEELLVGAAIPVHKHVNEDEYFFFTQGTGSIQIENETFTFKPGTTAFVPKNTWHRLKSTGDDKVIFTFGYSPAGFEGFFREIGTPKGQPFKAKSKQEFDMIARKYGMVFQ